jgi:rhomboid protease GluP
VSVGASGAVYALIAALIILAIVNEDLRKRFNAATLLIVAIAAIVDGFFSAENIGNAAHIGGFVAGIVLAYVMDMISVYRKKT